MMFPLTEQVLLAQAAGSALAAPETGETAATSSTTGRMIYQIARLRAFEDDRWPLALTAAAAVAIVGIVWYLYRRDTAELRRPVGIAIALLRTLALAGLLVFFLGIERRTTREITHNSQVAMLVDVSQSMGIGDSPASGGETRVAEVVRTLAESPLIGDLQLRHDVNVARFDREVEPVTALPKGQEAGEEGRGARSVERGARSVERGAAGQATDPGQLSAEYWSTRLQPRGVETRLGEALSDQLRRYRNTPLAGIVVVSDGGQNAGLEPNDAIELAREAGVPIYSIGVGSAEVQRNVALRDFVIPARAFPGDTLNVIGYVQAHGYVGRVVEAQLVRRGADDPAGSGTTVATEQVVLGADDEIVAVSFDVEPADVGTFVYQLRLVPPPDDGNAADNGREAEVVIVERKTKVLLFAGGPMRDYQYLRNQLYRDPTMTVDVLLQTAQPGISQDAHEILDAFPESAEELFQYDCLVAFDPDWAALAADQIELVERWVAEEAGGLIAVAGPIQSPKWIRSSEHTKVRDLYPVVFQERLTLLDDGQFGGDTPWPLAFERAGREAKFLWLAPTAAESAAAWDDFPGFYGYYAVKGEKPGATVYARFSDPEAGLTNERPVYLASHFYGAGQVFYIGSGELWRLRRADPRYFEVLTTKLIRHVSQGRLLRGSTRGTLLVERDRYELGESVVVRARLADAQHKPLDVDSVTAQLLRPDGVSEPLKLSADSNRPGMYVGQTAVLQEGTYQLALSVPDSSEETLSRYLQVRVPDLERTHAERNDALLAALAQGTGGVYYNQLDAAVRGDDGIQPLSQMIKSRAEVKSLTGAPDQEFAQAQMKWLMGIIAGSLFVEWIVRRLNRLA